MFGNPLVSGLYARGTLCAGVGLTVIVVYYVRAWRLLQARSEPFISPDNLLSTESHRWPELRYLKRGMFASVLFFMLAVAAEAPNDWLYRLTGCLIGFCAAISFAFGGLAMVSLANLWKELVLQLKQARIGSLLWSVPLALLCLALGLGALVVLGMFVDRVPSSWAFPIRLLLWVPIAIVFYILWKGRSHVALMLRLILMVSFSVIIIAALAFAFWWMTSQATPLLMVIFLCALGSLNVVFYSHWVRLAALKHSLR
jgi:hypothetical protein